MTFSMSWLDDRAIAPKLLQDRLQEVPPERSILLFLFVLWLGLASPVWFQPGFAAQIAGDAQTDSAVREFENYLGTLDPAQKRSILAARQEFLNKFSASQPKVRADGFRSFLAFYGNVVQRCDADFLRKKDLQRVLHLLADETGSKGNPLSALAKSRTPVASELKAKYQRELAELQEYTESGIDFKSSEGDWYLQEDACFLLELTTSLSGEYHDYMRFRIQESQQRVVEDAALQVSWDDLGRKIARWERFAAEHPSLPEAKTTMEPQIERMMSWYLVGVDNTPAYDFSKGGTIDPRLFQSYGKFVRQNSRSRHFVLISGIYESLKKSQCRINKQVLDLLKSAGYQNQRLERNAARLFATVPQ
ncbi:MAG: hypothetical protein LLG20_14755 [Acidobacteriales bacterium]|nr:hypothetical protein [Terriglobales bacterium]